MAEFIDSAEFIEHELIAQGLGYGKLYSGARPREFEVDEPPAQRVDVSPGIKNLPDEILLKIIEDAIRLKTVHKLYGSEARVSEIIRSMAYENFPTEESIRKYLFFDKPEYSTLWWIATSRMSLLHQYAFAMDNSMSSLKLRNMAAKIKSKATGYEREMMEAYDEHLISVSDTELFQFVMYRDLESLMARDSAFAMRIPQKTVFTVRNYEYDLFGKKTLIFTPNRNEDDNIVLEVNPRSYEPLQIRQTTAWKQFSIHFSYYTWNSSNFYISIKPRNYQFPRPVVKYYYSPEFLSRKRYDDQYWASQSEFRGYSTPFIEWRQPTKADTDLPPLPPFPGQNYDWFERLVNKTVNEYSRNKENENKLGRHRPMLDLIHGIFKRGREENDPRYYQL